MSQPGIQPGNASEPPTKFGVKGARVLPGEHVCPAGLSPRGPLMPAYRRQLTLSAAVLQWSLLVWLASLGELQLKLA